jgi:hypothetical protein
MTTIDWTTIRKQANDALTDNPAVEEFRQRMNTLFTRMLQRIEPPYRRRPAVSLRLICQVVPASKLIIHPGWSRRRGGGAVNTERIDCELLQERITDFREQPVRKFDRLLTLRVAQDEKAVNLIRSNAVNDVMTTLGTMEEFLLNPKSVLARSHDNCCCCGRSLRDELSRSRGIGPECIRGIGFLLYGQAQWNGLIKEVVDV